MVKERRRKRSKSSSSDSEDSDNDRRRRKERSRSPRRPGTSSRHQEDYSRTNRMPKIKQEPLSDSDEEERHSKRRIKEEHGSYRHDDRERDRNRHRPVHVKQERHDRRDERSSQNRERSRNDARRRETHHQRQSNLSEHERYGRKQDNDAESANASSEPKDAPNFELSGKLTEDTNTYKGIVIKYNEPPEARKPKKRWRLYPFKNDEPMKPFHMHRQSAFLLGRERLVADIPIDHPSCSKQHAVFQYRMVPYEKEDGRRAFRIAPYIIDLNSANGTFVNNKKIEPQRYYELFEKDVIKFGFSSREYVLLHDKSSTAELEEEEFD